MIKRRLRKLQDKFGLKPVVVVTEKVSSFLWSEKMWFGIVQSTFSVDRICLSNLFSCPFFMCI